MSSIKFEIKPEDINDFISHTIKYDRNYLRTKFLGGLIIPFVLLWIWFVDTNKTVGDIIVVLFLIAIWLWLYWKWVDYMFWHKRDKIKKQWQTAGLFEGDIEITIVGYSLNVKTVKWESKFELAYLYKVYETPKFLFVYVSSTKVIVIPKGRLKSWDINKFKEEILRFTRCK